MTAGVLRCGGWLQELWAEPAFLGSSGPPGLRKPL
jgi:hypothetical protein